MQECNFTGHHFTPLSFYDLFSFTELSPLLLLFSLSPARVRARCVPLSLLKRCACYQATRPHRPLVCDAHHGRSRGFVLWQRPRHAPSGQNSPKRANFHQATRPHQEPNRCGLHNGASIFLKLPPRPAPTYHLPLKQSDGHRVLCLASCMLPDSHRCIMTARRNIPPIRGPAERVDPSICVLVREQSGAWQRLHILFHMLRIPLAVSLCQLYVRYIRKAIICSMP